MPIAIIPEHHDLADSVKSLVSRIAPAEVLHEALETPIPNPPPYWRAAAEQGLPESQGQPVHLVDVPPDEFDNYYDVLGLSRTARSCLRKGPTSSTSAANRAAPGPPRFPWSSSSSACCRWSRGHCSSACRCRWTP